MKENRKVLCYDIISYMSVLVGFDVTKLGDDEIILMVEKLQELSDYNVEDSVHQQTKGIRLYRIKPLDTSISYEFIEEKNIIQAYSMYYEEKEEK